MGYSPWGYKGSDLATKQQQNVFMLIPTNMLIKCLDSEKELEFIGF